jgi:hypothetical protein
MCCPQVRRNSETDLLSKVLTLAGWVMFRLPTRLLYRASRADCRSMALLVRCTEKGPILFLVRVRDEDGGVWRLCDRQLAAAD